jgi:phthalate 4,5-dioxygenase
VLTKEQNDLVTLTGPQTPGGDLLRRYWQPVALAREIPAGSAPKPVRIFGEDLVLFRTQAGEPALLGIHCPHRGADLSYGRIEGGGLRCVYHGWVMAVDGRCLEQPGEPAGSSFAARTRHTAYPCREAGGLILTYMGPGEPPLLPSFEFITSPAEQTWCTKLYQECNYLQGSEGNVDPQHLSYLHRFVDPDKFRESHSLVIRDPAPQIDVDEMPWGLRLYAARNVSENERYVRVTNFIMPNNSAFSASPPLDPKVQPLPRSTYYKMHWHVPIDDTHHWKYEIAYRKDGPVDPVWLASQYENADNPAAQLKRRADNRYLQDRSEQNRSTFTGMGRNFNDHDRFATESQGPIYNRTTEHLATTDKGVIAMRRLLLKAIDDVRVGRDPLLVNRDAALNPLADLVVLEELLPKSMPVHEFWRVHA